MATKVSESSLVPEEEDESSLLLLLLLLCELDLLLLLSIDLSEALFLMLGTSTSPFSSSLPEQSEPFNLASIRLGAEQHFSPPDVLTKCDSSRIYKAERKRLSSLDFFLDFSHLWHSPRCGKPAVVDIS